MIIAPCAYGIKIVSARLLIVIPGHTNCVQLGHLNMRQFGPGIDIRYHAGIIAGNG